MLFTSSLLISKLRMNPSSTLEPALVYRSEKATSEGFHWTAWNVDGEQILNGLGSFEMFVALLNHRGHYMVSPNSAFAMDLRNKFRDQGIK